MTIGPQASVVFLIGPDFNRPQKPAQYRRHKLERWRERREIPQRGAERIARRRLVEEMHELARKAIEDVRPQVEAMLAHVRGLTAQMRAA